MRPGVAAPCSFRADANRGPAPLAYTLTVQGPAPDGTVVTRQFAIRRREHVDFLDLLAALARDFGMRMPGNRSKQTPSMSSARYQTLLTRPVGHGILYGYGDPAVLRAPESGEYYVYCTSNDAPDSFPILRSADLHRWRHAGFIFPRGLQPSWAATGEYLADYWAPEVHLVNGEYRAWFVARHRQTSELCIGMAAGNSPEGPFLPSPEPLLQGDCIDPHVFVKRSGLAYLYWKEDRNAVWPSQLNALVAEYPHYIPALFGPREDDLRTASFLAAVWPWVRTLPPMERFFLQQAFIESVTVRFAAFESQLRELAAHEADTSLRLSLNEVIGNLKTRFLARELSPEGISLKGEAVKVLENDQEWEGHVVEGMWISELNRRFYMFYSGNDFSTAEYGIGVAVSDSPLGPFRKMPRAWLQSSAEWVAPGHPSLAAGPNGRPLLFLHAYLPDHVGYKQFRALLGLELDMDSLSRAINP